MKTASSPDTNTFIQRIPESFNKTPDYNALLQILQKEKVELISQKNTLPAGKETIVLTDEIKAIEHQILICNRHKSLSKISFEPDLTYNPKFEKIRNLQNVLQDKDQRFFKRKGKSKGKGMNPDSSRHQHVLNLLRTYCQEAQENFEQQDFIQLKICSLNIKSLIALFEHRHLKMHLVNLDVQCLFLLWNANDPDLEPALDSLTIEYHQWVENARFNYLETLIGLMGYNAAIEGNSIPDLLANFEYFQNLLDFSETQSPHVLSDIAMMGLFFYLKNGPSQGDLLLWWDEQPLDIRSSSQHLRQNLVQVIFREKYLDLLFAAFDHIAPQQSLDLSQIMTSPDYLQYLPSEAISQLKSNKYSLKLFRNLAYMLLYSPNSGPQTEAIVKFISESLGKHPEAADSIYFLEILSEIRFNQDLPKAVDMAIQFFKTETTHLNDGLKYMIYLELSNFQEEIHHFHKIFHAELIRHFENIDPKGNFVLKHFLSFYDMIQFKNMF